MDAISKTDTKKTDVRGKFAILIDDRKDRIMRKEVREFMGRRVIFRKFQLCGIRNRLENPKIGKHWVFSGNRGVWRPGISAAVSRILETYRRPPNNYRFKGGHFSSQTRLVSVAPQQGALAKNAYLYIGDPAIIEQRNRTTLKNAISPFVNAILLFRENVSREGEKKCRILKCVCLFGAGVTIFGYGPHPPSHTTEKRIISERQPIALVSECKFEGIASHNIWKATHRPSI